MDKCSSYYAVYSMYSKKNYLKIISTLILLINEVR